MYKLINYKIVNGELHLNIKLDIENIDFSSEFSKEFFSENYNKIRNEILRLIKKHKINFNKGKVILLVNGTLLATMMLTACYAIDPKNNNNITTNNQNIVPVDPNFTIPELLNPTENIQFEYAPELVDPTENIQLEYVAELRQMNLILISGHANRASDPGAVFNNRYESEYAQELVMLIKSELAKKENININVILEPYAMALANEVTFLKGTKADYAISIHFNSGGGSGTEIIVPYNSSDLTIAEQVINNFRKLNQPIRLTSIYSKSSTEKTARKNGVKVASQRDYYGIIRAGQEVKMHSEIIEVEFIDNDTNMNFYNSNKIKYAKAIADAIESYYEINFKV